MSIYADGLFAGGEIFKRTVKLGDDQEYEMYFKQLPGIEFIRYREVSQSENREERIFGIANLIAASLCEPDGAKAMTPEKAATLLPGPMSAIFEQVLQVNGQSTKKKD